MFPLLQGLLEQLHKLVPLSRTRVCVRHLYNNFKVQWPGKAFKDSVWAAARAFTEEEFKVAMSVVRACDEKAYNYLMGQNPITWSRHGFSKSTRSDMLLNNMCESFNAWIVPARDKPVLSLCEWIRRQLMQRFVRNREAMQKYSDAFTPSVKKQIEAYKMEGTRNCQALWDGGSKFEVDHRGRTYIVDLDKKTCNCNRWDLTGIPCSHVMCCLMKERKNVEEYVDRCYTKEMYLKAYGQSIHVMPDKFQYEKTGMTPPGPPKYVVQPGRPKKHARVREADEKTPGKRIRVAARKPKCSNCGHSGHNKTKCTNRRISSTQTSSPGVGGRPKNPNIVHVGSQKRKVQFYIALNIFDKMKLCN